MRNRHYEHKYDMTRQLVAVQITAENVGEIAEWTNGRELEGATPAVEISVQGGASSVVAVQDDYVILDSNHEFHVRSPQIFEAKYRPTDSQDEELDFDTSADAGQEDDYSWGNVESDEKGYIPSTPDELSGETEDADRRQ